MKCILTVVCIVIFSAALTVAGIVNVPAEYETIQEGIEAAIAGDTVLVAEGTYVENINFMGKAITVASIYLIDADTSHISNTVIDGSEPSDADSGSVVFFVSGEDTTSVLSGFTIKNGSGTITEYTFNGNAFPIRAGGGILCYNSGAKISHNLIMNNHITHDEDAGGGGIAAYPVENEAYVIVDGNQIVENTITGTGSDAFSGGLDMNCNGMIKNNDISYNMSNATNHAFGAVGCWTDGSHPHGVVVKNNTITYNISTGDISAYAGGLTIETGMSATVLSNDISFNELNAPNASQGGGIRLYLESELILIDGNTISNNVVHGRSGEGGGILLFNNTNHTVIANNLIFQNSASAGGGIYNRGSESEIINNTIINNSASEEGGGYGEFSIPTSANAVIVNTILWGNQAASNSQIQGAPEIRYSNIEGDIWEGEGNLSLDPSFADTLYHLSDNSPCIVAGIDSINIDNSWYLAPSTDWSGNQRPDPEGSLPDIGALENDLTVAYAHHLKISKTFVKPDIDSVLVTASVGNPDGHDLSVTADMQTLDDEFVESVNLLDDGMHGDGEANDDIWGAYYTPGNEHTLKVSLTINDDTEGTSRTRHNLNQFTSTGPIVVTNPWIPWLIDDSEANPGDYISFKIQLENTGKINETVDIKAKLVSVDPGIEVLDNEASYGTIIAGDTAESSQGFNIKISENFSKDTTIYLPLEIYSEGSHFWTAFMQLDIITALMSLPGKMPITYTLDQNYPNPFNPTTTITFALPKPEDVSIAVFNTLGQKVKTLVNQQMQAGQYSVDFDAANLGSGVYWYLIKAGKFKDVKKMVILK
jgi:hypothetical protein